ncbi:MAG: hypothetical protein ACU833_14500, partial [Gammaproteobacteria bacterium]
MIGALKKADENQKRIVATTNRLQEKLNWFILSRFAGMAITRRDGRAVEGARLESVYTATYRGFESL